MIILTPTPNTDKKDNFQFSTVTGFLSTEWVYLQKLQILAILFDHTRSVFHEFSVDHYYSTVQRAYPCSGLRLDRSCTDGHGIILFAIFHNFFTLGLGLVNVHVGS